MSAENNAQSTTPLRARWGRVVRSVIIVGLAIFNADQTLEIAKFGANRGYTATVLLVSFLWFGIGLMINIESRQDI